jgi:septum formation protein
MHLIKPLILASRSPRRVGLLRQIGFPVQVASADVPEEFDPKASPAENACRLALEKATVVGRRTEDAFIIGADTIVVLGDTLLAKPRDPADAVRMLEMLSGHTHMVCTGFSLLDRPSNRAVTEVETTLVTFRNLPRVEIEEYVAAGSPLDKAGAYGIQDDYGAVFVTRIEGCFYNVVGFPLAKFYTTLQDFQSQFVKELKI